MQGFSTLWAKDIGNGFDSVSCLAEDDGCIGLPCEEELLDCIDSLSKCADHDKLLNQTWRSLLLTGCLNALWFVQNFVGEFLYVLGHGCRKEKCLMIRIHLIDDVFQILSKSHAEHFICFIQNENFVLIQIDISSLHVVAYTSRGSNEYGLRPFVQLLNLFLHRSPADESSCDVIEATQSFDFVNNLQCKFSSWTNNDARFVGLQDR